MLATLAAVLVASAPASASPAPLATPFPRLAVWWPASGAPADALARYDLVVLHDFDLTRATAVRSLHPGALILDSTDACEVPYDAYDVTANDALRAIPAQWLLTQQGSTLAAPASASDAVFRVAAATRPDGGHLFEPGEMVVVDDEIARIDSISGTTLTVRRGKVKTPVAHAAGARISSAVSYWHGYLVTDLSGSCPRLPAAGGASAETWGEYAARHGAALVHAPWDGLFVDRADGNASWLVTSGAARSIDTSRDNTAPSDYSAFDTSWNAGLRDYEQRLRTALGPSRILVTNWGRPNFDIINGDCFEAFPAAGDGHSYNGTWLQTAFGPLPGSGGYLEWDASALQPRVSMVAQYRLDSPQREPASGAPDPVGGADVAKARFGIGTALLGDGFYSYTLNDGGPEAGDLAWFDTFDGGGLGRGYLGSPSAEVTRAVAPLTTPDRVTLGGFASQTELDGWPLWLRTGYAGTVTLDGAYSPAGAPSARVTLTQAAGKEWEAHLTRGGVATLTAGSEYTVSFWAKADRARTMAVWVQGDGDDTRRLADFGEVALDTTWRRYEVSVPAAASSGSAGARLHFGLGGSVGSVWLDGVRLQEGSTAVWRREYGGGVVVVNGSAAPKTVVLGGWYQAFRGTQDQGVDDGRIVTTLSVPPLDARILVRPAVVVLPQLDRACSLWRRVAASADTARAKCTAAAAKATGTRRLRLLAAAAGWRRARDAALTALSAEATARSSLVVQDSAASRLALDGALAAAQTAARATAVRDPLASRQGHDARACALTALSLISAAHDTLP